ncbi:hypothetical protein ACHAXA_003681 [Cyclostephanos tholiformis]|uniref:Uncharacterized protein n=1 Tax=Cyclostephanos tholiformis TaxID=382380 RepID=A0ABD3SQ10_9STRA
MATPLRPVECSAQPLCISFHPYRDIVAAGLIDGTVELHDLKMARKTKKTTTTTTTTDTADASSRSRRNDDDEDEDDDDTILASVYVAGTVSRSATHTSCDYYHGGGGGGGGGGYPSTRVGPSCRCVLFSRGGGEGMGEDHDGNDMHDGYLYTACNLGSLRCLDAGIACGGASSCMSSSMLDEYDEYDDEYMHDDAPPRAYDRARSSSPAILWSIEKAHGAGISRMYQLPHSSPCGPLLVTGDDIGTIRLWDTRRMCEGGGGRGGGGEEGGGRGGGGGGWHVSKERRRGDDNSCVRGTKNDYDGEGNDKRNPFDDLMKLPPGCVQHWRVNTDYISDIVSSDDGMLLFATSGDGTLSVFDLQYVRRANTSRCVAFTDTYDDDDDDARHKRDATSWESHGYARSDNQEDELLSVLPMKRSKRVLCGTQGGTLCLFSYGRWSDISDRYPGHPQSIDALLKVDEDTVLTGSSDGLVRAVQILPNMLLGVLGSHDGFPVEDMKWSNGRKMVGSISHDEYIRLWDASLLNDDDEEDDDDGGNDSDMREETTTVKATTTAKANNATRCKADVDSEDGWEDMDEDEDGDDEDADDSNDVEDDDDADDSDDSGDGGKPKKRDKIFKTENESFFSDL